MSFCSLIKGITPNICMLCFNNNNRELIELYNRRFPEITGEDNLTVFSYSRRVKSPEWRWQQRRADLRHFEIFRHGPIIIYTRLPAVGTYYQICTFPVSSERLIGISDAFSAFYLRVSIIFPTCSLYPQQKRAYSALHPQAWTYIYRSMPEGSYRVQSPGFRRWSVELNKFCPNKQRSFEPFCVWVFNYGSGWRKDVVNHCLEFVRALYL